MKKLIISTLISLIFACTDEHVLHANLRMVSDRHEIRTDEMNNHINIRSIYVYYLAINNSKDSIHIPIGYPYDNSVTVNIKSRESLKTTIYRERCNKFNGHVGQQYFASGDSILISFLFHIYPRNSIDSEWLWNVSTKELTSTLELKMVRPTNVEDAERNPNVIFNNDTNDICINPVIKVRNSNRNHRVGSTDHFSN